MAGANFTENQKTGTLAEMDVERLFTSWSWSIGKDRIDSGYDLFVEPDHSRFRGQRFLVQVKGTARGKKGAPTARVKKSNLRKYAANTTPIFLIRSDVDRTLYWLHVQRWALINQKRLKGEGEATIIMPRDQRLDEPEAFYRYLETLSRPMSERVGALAEAAQERTAFLSSLDPRLIVNVGLRNGSEIYEISARNEPTTIGLQLTPMKDPKNMHRLRDAIQYGMPATIDVESFQMTGSELFGAIGADNLHRGSVSIGPASTESGAVHIYAGDRFSMLATVLSRPAQLYRGTKGFSISTNQSDDLIGFKLRANMSVANITLEISGDRLGATPVQEHVNLANIGEWANNILIKKSAFIELAFCGHRLHLKLRVTDDMEDFFYRLFILGRLHQVARALNSTLTVTEELILNKEDISNIHCLYAILRGERVRINIGPIKMPNPCSVEIPNRPKLLIKTELKITISTQLLGIVPVAIDLDDFVVEKSNSGLKLSSGSEGRATMYYDESRATLL